MNQSALVPSLLRDSFALLHPLVQVVHSGNSDSWTGRATVQRGAHPLLRIAAAIARLPPSLRDVPTTVTIEAREGREIWTRRFGDAASMRSRVSRKDGDLVERMGPLAIRFRVEVDEGAMIWTMRHIAWLGLPLPASWFQLQVRADSSGGVYRFFVAVHVTRLGQLIRYEGELDIPGQR